MAVRIVSDGTSHGTRVLNEAGEPIGVVQEVTWTIRADGVAQAVIVCAMAQLDAVVEKVEVRAALQADDASS